MMTAVEENSVAAVKEALDSGGDVNAEDEVRSTRHAWRRARELTMSIGTQAQWRALHKACAYHGHYMEEADPDDYAERLEIVKLLVDRGADLDATTRVRRHPVTYLRLVDSVTSTSCLM